MTPIILIPARLASRRLPNKPLVPIGADVMIVHVARRAARCRINGAPVRVVVAAGDEEIVRVVQAAGMESIYTRPEHPSGSDRIYEALQILDGDGIYDCIINVQGDLPTLDPAIIEDLIKPLALEGVDITTPVALMETPDEIQRPSIVKAMLTPAPNALPDTSDEARHFMATGFSRTPCETGPHYHHMGIYAWRRVALTRFIALPPSANEQRESLEQLRALDNGMRIDAMRIDDVPCGVDTPADLEMARRLLAPE